MAKCGHAGEKKPHCNKTNKRNYHLKLCTFFCLSCPSATFALRHGSFEPHECRTVAWFFPTGGIIASAEGLCLLGGSGVILPKKNFKFGGSKMLFSALVRRDVSKNRPRISVKRQVIFSAYILQVFTSEVLLI